MALGLFASVVAACAVAPSSLAADFDAEVELAQRYAPSVRLVAQPDECGRGEPYDPIDVDWLLPLDEVALRGPWDTTNVVEVAPDAEDLGVGLYEYHLDFPGTPLEPACTYEMWSKRVVAGRTPTVYGHVVTQPEYPGRLALQYWFYYLFNDFNNKHEGDWEMIQLNFAADDATEALDTTPVEIGYSQHEGGERAAWGSSKLEIVDGTHPVVYPARGSHANYFDSAVYLGRSGAQGVGCDNTVGPSREFIPSVRTIPSDPEAARVAYPWIAYEGHWGEKQPAFYNGPTGPNLKLQWTQPITWSEESWRDRSFAVPSGGSFGPAATDFFCAAVASGSNLLTRATRNPLPVFLGLAGIVGLLIWGLTRTTWRGTAPLRLARRRAWGELVTCAWRLYRQRLGLFLRIGLLFVPVGLVVAVVQYVLFRVTVLDPLVDSAGESNALVGALVLGLGVVVTVLALTVVQAATAFALVEIDEDRPGSALDAYRLVLGRLGTLAGALAVVVAAVIVLSFTLVGLVIAVWLAVRWSLLAQAIALHGDSVRGALRRSNELVRGHWFRVATFTIVVAGLALLAGLLTGALLLFATDASFNVVNVVTSLVYAVTLPFVTIATTYLYHDLTVRRALEPDAPADPVLPAELSSSHRRLG